MDPEPERSTRIHSSDFKRCSCEIFSLAIFTKTILCLFKTSIHKEVIIESATDLYRDNRNRIKKFDFVFLPVAVACSLGRISIPIKNKKLRT